MGLLRLAALFIGVVSTAASAGPSDGYRKTSDPKKIGWMDRGMESVKNKIKDPDSAKFRSVYFHQGADGIPVTCGEVNSKNSLGGYVGYQRFVSAGKPELTWLEEQVSDFRNLWARLCN